MWWIIYVLQLCILCWGTHLTGGTFATLPEVNLDQLSGESQYNLLNSLGNNSFDSPFPNSFISPYPTNEQMFDHISDNSFSMVSINIRSLPGKITELANFLDNKGGKKIDIVSMQEIWNVPTGVQLNIEGYHPLLYKIRDMSGQKSNVGGGVSEFLLTMTLNMNYWMIYLFLTNMFLRAFL